MRLLLDTHIIFWAVIEPGQLSPDAAYAIEAKENESCVSVASLWEVSIKVGNGKWPEAAALVANFEVELAKFDFSILPISTTLVRIAGLMSSPHRDPFDRLLAAQAIIEGLTLVSADSKIASLGAPCLW